MDQKLAKTKPRNRQPSTILTVEQRAALISKLEKAASDERLSSDMRADRAKLATQLRQIQS